MTEYESREGDMLDEIAARFYGVVNDEVINAVLAANPGAAALGPRLPLGTIVRLPALKREDAMTAAPVVKLWQ